MIEMPTFVTEATRVARKRHACCECGAFIEPGEPYQRFTGGWDGAVETFKVCIPCQTARDWLTNESEQRDIPLVGLQAAGAYTFRGLAEELHEFATEVSPGDGVRFGAWRRFVELTRRRAPVGARS